VLGFAYGSLLLSALTCYLIGLAVIAPSDAWLRKRSGIMALIVASLSFVPLPPQLTLLGSVVEGPLATAGISLGWPTSVSKPVYLVVWGITSLAAVLVGMRVWNAGKPGWRESSSSRANDSSSVGRARALLTMVDSLEDGLDALARTGVDRKGAEQLGEELHTLGRRYADSLPESAGDVYRLVATRVSPGLANVVTRHLLEGAARGGYVTAKR